MIVRPLLSGLLLVVPLAAVATDAAPPDASSGKTATSPPAAAALAPQVEKLFAAKAKDGTPVVPPDLQAYFRGQPSHLRDLFAKKLDEGLIGPPEQAQRLLSLRLSGQNLELLLSDNCILCHTNPDNQSEQTLFTLSPPKGEATRAHLSLGDFVNDVHFRSGLSCSGCHGGKPTDQDMSDEIYQRWPADDVRVKDRSWIPGFCARCHSDPQFMREYAPGLPTDQLAKYKTSRHGQLLLEEGDSKAAQCVSCHGVHGILGPESPTSKVHPLNIPSTCGACHANAEYMAGYEVHGEPIPTDQVAQYEKSVHGVALLKKHDMGAPVCNTCHGNHAAMPPGVNQVALVCRNCHTAEANYFDASPHADAFEEHDWPQCVQCHGKHDIEHPTEDKLVYAQGHLCYDCHTKYAPDDEECRTTPPYFRDRILKLDGAVVEYKEQAQKLAERGLDVDALQAATSELSDDLKSTRARIHSFDRSTFDETANEGQKASDKAQGIVAKLRRDYRFRTIGLLVSVGIMGVLALGIWIRVRDLSRRNG